MNFDVVKQKYPSAVETDWHQHTNGGGWVANSASVPESVHISECATVGYWATVGDGARVGYWATVGDGARVGYGATVGNRARVGYGATVGNRARVGEEATVGYGATVGDGARVGYGATVGNRARVGEEATVGDGYRGDILYISTATGHSITATREAAHMVQIGCRRMTIEEWIEKADAIGRAEKYSPATIAVYRGLLAAVLAWMDAALDAEEAQNG